MRWLGVLGCMGGLFWGPAWAQTTSTTAVDASRPPAASAPSMDASLPVDARSPMDAQVSFDAGSSVDSEPTSSPGAKDASVEVDAQLERPTSGARRSTSKAPAPEAPPKTRRSSSSGRRSQNKSRRNRSRAGRPPPPSPPTTEPPPSAPVVPVPSPEPPPAALEATLSSSVADDGPGVLGSIFETLLRTGGARPPQTVESKDPTLAETLWSVLRVLVLVFLILRMALWAVRAGSRAGSRSAQLLQRIWLMLEGSTWALTVVWIVTRVAARESVGAAVLAVMVVVLLLAVSWTALLDVAAGIVLAAERPFGVGDFVQIQRRAQIIEGQVRALRSRVMEIETRGGLRMRLPYRWAAGATAVRPGGGRTAHAVTLTLELPESMEPSEGLRVAEALAASAPWAALGLPPRVEMTDEPVSALRVQAYAFSEAAEPLLRASLVAGWRDIVRKAKSVDSAPRVP